MNTPAEDWEARAMSYSLDDDEQEEQDAEVDFNDEKIIRLERLLEAEEKRQREQIKRDCYAGLLALGLLPRSLAVDYVRRGLL